MIDPAIVLVVARVLLFLATGQLAGALFFDLSVAPLQRGRHLAVWGSWATTVGATSLWLVAQAALFGHRQLGDVVGSGVLAVTLLRTHFGHVIMVEMALAVATALALAAASVFRRRPAILAILPAASMSTALAWIGHGNDGRGLAGAVHLGADMVHLLAMSVWLGGLLPLALMMTAARQNGEAEAIAKARRAIWRFSSRCLWAVGVLAIAGLVNAWFLVGSLHAFFMTAYGQLLLVKICLFSIMFGLAAVNRELLLPQMTGSLLDRASRSLHRMSYNTVLIGLLGMMVLAVVAKLGTLPPALDDMPGMRMSQQDSHD